MRRWFKIGQGSDGNFFHPTKNEDAVFLSMPFVDELVEILNKSRQVNARLWYTDDPGAGDVDLCTGTPAGQCNGGDGTVPHNYVPSGDVTHLWIPESSVHKIVSNANILSSLLNGFLDRDGNPAPVIFSEDFAPPSKNG